jgi:hypothetical protein
VREQAARLLLRKVAIEAKPTIESCHLVNPDELAHAHSASRGSLIEESMFAKKIANSRVIQSPACEQRRERQVLLVLRSDLRGIRGEGYEGREGADCGAVEGRLRLGAAAAQASRRAVVLTEIDVVHDGLWIHHIAR